MILYQDCSSHLDSTKNTAARGQGLFSLYIYIENFKNLLVRNHWTDFNITRQDCFICSLLPRLFKLSWFVKKRGRQWGRAYFPNISIYKTGWLGGVKVLCILHHRGVQLILAYSWARPAILVAGKGRGGMFLFLLFLHFHSCSSFFSVPLFHLLYCLFYLFSPFLWETTQNDPQGLTCR